ncbi:unnamed protein product [Gadus morhua 'NCC']
MQKAPSQFLLMTKQEIKAVSPSHAPKLIKPSTGGFSGSRIASASCPREVRLSGSSQGEHLVLIRQIKQEAWTPAADGEESSPNNGRHHHYETLITGIRHHPRTLLPSIRDAQHWDTASPQNPSTINTRRSALGYGLTPEPFYHQYETLSTGIRPHPRTLLPPQDQQDPLRSGPPGPLGPGPDQDPLDPLDPWDQDPLDPQDPLDTQDPLDPQDTLDPQDPWDQDPLDPQDPLRPGPPGPPGPLGPGPDQDPLVTF